MNKGTSDEKLLDASFLLEQTHVSKSEGQITWFQEPHFEDGEIKGTFRHKNCLHASYKGGFIESMCKFCRSIEFIPTFRQRILNHEEDSEKQQDKKNFSYLPADKLIEKLRSSKEKESQLKDKIFLLTSNLKRTREHCTNYKENLKQLCKKGEYNVIAYNVVRAIKEKKISGKEGVLDIIKTISSNLKKEKSSRGKRHSHCKTTAEYYESLLIMFGPKAVVFAADNLHGPDVDTVRLWKKQKSYQFEFQNQERSIMMVSEIYKKLKEKHKESRPIPFMMMEDETAIDQRIEYDASTDCVYGFCGLKGEQHKCEDHYLIKVRCCMQRIFTFKRSNFTYVELFGQVLLPLVTTGGRTGSVHIQHKPSNIVGPMFKVILNWCLC